MKKGTNNNKADKHKVITKSSPPPPLANQRHSQQKSTHTHKFGHIILECSSYI
jgi:hypothetical protein